jgi:hypothetical protein
LLNNISTNGAVFSNGSNHFTDCTFEGNAAALAYISPWSYYGDGVGGALAFVSGVDTVQNCRFIDNASSREDRDPFTFKVSWYGGALFCYPDASPYLVNCLFTGNNMNQFDCHGTGSVMYNQQGHPTFEYCTMDDNDASGGFFDMGDYGTLNGPGGVIVSDGGSITLTNCILSGSEASAGVRFIQSSSAELYHNDFFGITGGNFADDIPPGLGVLSTLNANSDSCDVFYNLLLDPVYADAVNGDFHLQELSPCIGAADPLSMVSTDFEQNARPRPTGSNPDMGAYESASGGALAAVDDLTIYHDMLNHDIRLFWSPVAAATGYDIYVGADMVSFPANYTLIGTTSDSSYTDDDALLLPDHHRFYVVIATAQP